MNKAIFHSIARNTGFAIGLSIAATLFASPVAAQVLVTDEAAIASNHADSAASYLKQGLQFSKQLEQAETEASQLEQQLQMVQSILVKAQSLGSNIQLFNGQTLQPITDTDSVIQSACPGADTGVLGNLIGSLTAALDPNQPVTTRQQLVCTQIVLYQIDEYNKTADALNKIGPTNETTLDKLNDMISRVDTLGTSSNATAQAANITATMQTAMGTWQTEIQADEHIIQSLQKQQALLASLAMKGQNTILGTVVQAAALKAAFTINQ